jgi:ABC-type phosphate transport system substrate-binding protein
MWLAAAVTSVLTAGIVRGADFQLIANPGITVTELTLDEVKRIYLGTKTSIGGAGRAEPVLAEAGEVHESFLNNCIGKTEAALRNHYKSLMFTGKGGMPKSFASEAELVGYVAKTKGAIGYVASSAAPAGVKRIAVK